MPRSFTYSALTLRVRSSGGIVGGPVREAWFLTSEEGVIQATVFGGPKSRLRARVAPFHGGTLWIYHDPVRDSRKVSDFDVISYRTGIRELYERTMVADAVAETILASHGSGGSWTMAVELACSVLDALDNADPGTCTRMGIYFLWHWARILGVKPDLPVCSSCGEELSTKPQKQSNDTQGSACEPGRDGVLWYSTKKEALFCGKCLIKQQGDRFFSKDPGSLFQVGPGAINWFRGIESLSAGEITRVTMDAPSLDQARALSKMVLAGALGKKLPTWDSI